MVEINHDLVPDDIQLAILDEPLMVLAYAKMEGALLCQTAPSYSTREDVVAARALMEQHHPDYYYAIGPTPGNIEILEKMESVRITFFKQGEFSVWAGPPKEGKLSGIYQKLSERIEERV